MFFGGLFANCAISLAIDIFSHPSQSVGWHG